MWHLALLSLSLLRAIAANSECVIFPDVGHQDGGGYSFMEPNITAGECCELCFSKPECNGWTRTTSTTIPGVNYPLCLLYADKSDGIKYHGNCTSGNVFREGPRSRWLGNPLLAPMDFEDADIPTENLQHRSVGFTFMLEGPNTTIDVTHIGFYSPSFDCPSFVVEVLDTDSVDGHLIRSFAFENEGPKLLSVGVSEPPIRLPEPGKLNRKYLVVVKVDDSKRPGCGANSVYTAKRNPQDNNWHAPNGSSWTNTDSSGAVSVQEAGECDSEGFCLEVFGGQFLSSSPLNHFVSFAYNTIL